MRTWNLGRGDPLQLTLAADSRLSRLSFTNDTIWKLELAGGEPPALALYTTFGMRARAMHLFPAFITHNRTLTNPSAFSRPPVLTRLYPNFLEIHFSPYDNSDVSAEYWAAGSDVIAGRITFTNSSVLREKFRFEWCGLLNAGGGGMGLGIRSMGAQNVLAGTCEDLAIVCVISGGPETSSGSFAGLSSEVDLEPGATRQFKWACAWKPDLEGAYELAQHTTTRSWDAEIARIELTNESQAVEIQTGDPDWDAALMLSQRLAANLFYPAGEKLPFPSFVQNRQPTQGFSSRGDGSDYNHLWNGQSLLDAWYLAGLVLPGQAERIAGLIDNFLAVQKEDGFIDWKPGPLGQRSYRLAQPLLAGLAWQVFRLQEDPAWIRKVYPGLMAFLRCWLSAAHDRDQDDYPEWGHPYQPGLDQAPLFNPDAQTAQGVDPACVESPALAAMLYNEAGALYQIAEEVKDPAGMDFLAKTRVRLKANLDSCFAEENKTYTYRDALTHACPSGTALLEINEAGTFPLAAHFDLPQRVLLRLNSSADQTLYSHFILRGQTIDGPASEEISPRSVHWLHGNGRYTSAHHFLHVDEIVASGLLPGDHCRLDTIDLTGQDLSLLLPLWAGVPDPFQASGIICDTVMRRYLQPYGLAVCPPQDSHLAKNENAVVLPWNALIIEGLLRYGFRAEAAQILQAVMSAIILALKKDQAFFATYDAISGRGVGEKDLLSGVAPVNLFLKILGIQEFTREKLVIVGLNPFPWPVRVCYRGSQIDFGKGKTTVQMRDGREFVFQDGHSHEIFISPQPNR